MSRPAMVMGIETEYGIYVRSNEEREYARLVEEANEAIQHAIHDGADTMGRQLEITVGGRRAAYEHIANGARSYTDCGHPELSTAECQTPRELVVWDAASDRIVQMAARQASEMVGHNVVVYKKLIDGRGHTWGCHENYCITPRLYYRLTKEPDLLAEHRTLATWLCVRQLLTGQGKVGSDNHRRTSGFQLSQRADFIQQLRSDTTTHDRPLIQTRDEPLCEREGWQRLHIICGDANLCQWATYLKVSLTGLLLLLWQDPELKRFPPLPVVVDNKFADVVRFISHDSDLVARYPVRMIVNRGGRLGDLRFMTAAEILSAYVDGLTAYAQQRTWSSPAEADSYRTAAQKAQWAAGLLRARNWRGLYGWLDWPTKFVIIEELLRRKNRTWADVLNDDAFRRRVKLLADFNYAVLDPAVSIFDRIAKTGVIRTVVKGSEIARAVMNPPPGRASQRAAIAQTYPGYVLSAHWDNVSLQQAPYKIDINLEDPMGCPTDALALALSLCPTPLDLVAYNDLHPIPSVTISAHRSFSHA